MIVTRQITGSPIGMKMKEADGKKKKKESIQNISQSNLLPLYSPYSLVKKKRKFDWKKSMQDLVQCPQTATANTLIYGL